MLIYRGLLKSLRRLSQLLHRSIRAETDKSSPCSLNLTSRLELTWAWQAWECILPKLEPEMRGCRLHLFHLPHKPRCRARHVNVLKVWLTRKYWGWWELSKTCQSLVEEKLLRLVRAATCRECARWTGAEPSPRQPAGGRSLPNNH